MFVDADGVPNFADGFNMFLNEGENAGGQFTPLVLEVPMSVDPAQARVRFTYSCSDPAGVQRSGEGTWDDPFVYTPAPGCLRMCDSSATGGVDEANIDIHVEASDVQGTLPDQTPMSLSYWIEGPRLPVGGVECDNIRDAANPYKLMDFSNNMHFHNQVSTPPLDWVVDTNQNLQYSIVVGTETNPWPNYKHFIITNTRESDGTAAHVADTNYWNTNARNDSSLPTVVHANFAGMPDTTNAHNARFPDGDYDIHIISTDLIHANAEVIHKVRLENYPPIIEELVVYQDSDRNIGTPDNGENKGYERLVYHFKHENPHPYVVPAGVGYSDNVLTNYQKAIVGSGKNGRGIWTKVVFSEQMDKEWAEFSLQLDPQGADVGAGLTNFSYTASNWTNTHVNNDTIVATLNIPPKTHTEWDSKGKLGEGGDDFNRDAVIVIKARDLRDRNNNHRGMDEDSNGVPEADATDRNHRLKIDTKHDVEPDQKPHLKLKEVYP